MRRQQEETHYVGSGRPNYSRSEEQLGLPGQKEQGSCFYPNAKEDVPFEM
jgi:hypothetical protein